MVRGPDRIGWQHKARATEVLADLSHLVRTLDAYWQPSLARHRFKGIVANVSTRWPASL
jgi:hypothetical protein